MKNAPTLYDSLRSLFGQPANGSTLKAPSS